MIDFQYHTPTSLEEVFQLLSTHGDDARVIAGGTALITMMKQRLAQPEHVVSLSKVPGLGSIEASNGVLRLGAMSILFCVYVRTENAKNPPLGTPLPVPPSARQN